MVAVSDTSNIPPNDIGTYLGAHIMFAQKLARNAFSGELSSTFSHVAIRFFVLVTAGPSLESVVAHIMT